MIRIYTFFLFMIMAVCSNASPKSDALLPNPAKILADEVVFDAFDNTRYIKESGDAWSIDYVLDNLGKLEWAEPDIKQPIGRTADIYWFVINLKNADKYPEYVAARFIQFRAHFFEAYLVRDGLLQKTHRGGLSVPLDDDSKSTINTIHAVLEPGHDYQIFYRIDTQEYLHALHFTLAKGDKVLKDLYDIYTMIGIFCGVMFFIGAFNFVGFFFKRDYLYLVTGCWIVLITFHLMGYYASGFRYWLVDIPALNADFLLFSYYFSEILGVMFTMLLLNTRRNSPIIHRFLTGSVAVLIVIYFFIYDKPLFVGTEIAEIATLLLLPFLLAATIIAVKNKQAYAIFYLLALSILSLFFIAIVLAGIFAPENVGKIITWQLYVILSQMILISLSQIDRVRVMNLDMNQALHASNTDELTGVANRRAFDSQMEAALERCLHSGEPLSCLIMDIDFFKNYNDSLGHVAGDECLIKVAASIASSFSRDVDTVTRYGGEEFAVVLPGAGEQVAKRVAITILDAIHSEAIPHPDSGVSEFLTLSIGAATIYVGDKTRSKHLISMADEQLYLAKSGGRDRVCSISKQPPENIKTVS
jgi:diguanylate cyclase (GGDEF)-like protein